MIFPVLLLDEHPWHALDVFVRLLECILKNEMSFLCFSILQ